MKKSSLLVLTFFLTSVFTHSQSGKITYSVKSYLDPNKEIKSDIKPFIIALYEKVNTLKFELNFNKQQSSFKFVENSMSVDKDDSKTAHLVAAGENVYIDHLKKEEIHQNTDNILIKDRYEIRNWTITKESKKIDVYLCYKAIYKYDFVDRKGKNKTAEIIAWFAPSLPYNYAPKQYFGLPGLVLELQESNITFYATKIELSKKEIQINFPKGKTITREQYDGKMKANINITR